MDNIELFDKYIAKSLSANEASEFEARLKTDKDFNQDFKIYLATVRGIYREAEQDNADFGHALKSISKEQLQRIMGPRPKVEMSEAISDKPLHREQPSEQWRGATQSGTIALRAGMLARPWVAWATSMAAMIVVVFGMGLGFQRHADIRIMDNVYAMNITEIPTEFRGAEGVDFTEMNVDELKEYLPQLEEEYADSEVGDQDNIISGLQLSMVYIKLHKMSDAKDTLKKLAADYPNDPVGDQARTILKQLD